MSTLIQATKVYDPSSLHHHKQVDIFIDDQGVIEQIAPKIDKKATNVISFENLHVSCGWFDSSISLWESGFEQNKAILKELEAVSKSGFTEILTNANLSTVADNSIVIKGLLEMTAHTATKIYPTGALTTNSDGAQMTEIYDMYSSGAKAFGDYKKGIDHPNLLKTTLLYAQNFDGLIMSFPQETSIAGKGVANEGIHATTIGLRGIPAFAETLQIERDLSILRYTGGKLHIPTITTAESLALIINAKKEKLDVSCSVAIHHLLLTDEQILDFDTNYKVSPPLRIQKDIESLREGVLSGAVDFVTTDHCPQNIETKKVTFGEATVGTIGVDNAFGTLNKIFGLENTIHILTKGRERFGIECPSITQGKIANITLFNPEGEKRFDKTQIHSNAKNSAFIDTPIKGTVYGIYANQQLKIRG